MEPASVLRVLSPHRLVVCLDSGAVVSVLLDQPLCLGEAVSPQSPCWGHVTLGRYDMEERVFRGGCFRPDRTEIEAATTAYRRFLIDY
jgi:hypothetical protein